MPEPSEGTSKDTDENVAETEAVDLGSDADADSADAPGLQIRFRGAP